MHHARRLVTVFAGVAAGVLLASPARSGPPSPVDDSPLTTIPGVPAVSPEPAVEPSPIGPPAPQPEPEPRPASASGVFFWANAWAAHHTARTGYWSGSERMRRMVRIIEGQHVTLGALAELERSQIRAFRTHGSAYRLFLGGRGMTDGVFWDPSAFDLERKYTFAGYYAGGRRVRVPVAILRDRRTSDRLAVMAVHNPLDGYSWRERALARELQEVRKLRRTYGGDVSVFVAGDFNAGAAVACQVRSRSRLYSAGYRNCRGRIPIDQLLVDRSVRIHAVHPTYGGRMRSVTDHPAVYRAKFSIPQRNSTP